MNEFVSRVLDAATDPELTDNESLRVRERLAAAGLLATTGPPRSRPRRSSLGCGAEQVKATHSRTWVRDRCGE